MAIVRCSGDYQPNYVCVLYIAGTCQAYASGATVATSSSPLASVDTGGV